MFARESCASADLALEFQTLCTSLADLLSSENVKVRSFHPETPFFKRLSHERQQEVIRYLGFYYDLCLEHTYEGMSLKDNQTFTWRALKKCHLKPGSDLMDRIHGDSVIQFYSLENVQIFRNLRFFELCSYTLEDLYCREWWTLFERDHETNQIILNCARQLVNGELPAGVEKPAPKHLLRETASAEAFRLEIEMEFAGPLYCEGAIKAYLCIHSANFVQAELLT